MQSIGTATSLAFNAWCRALTQYISVDSSYLSFSSSPYKRDLFLLLPLFSPHKARASNFLELLGRKLPRFLSSITLQNHRSKCRGRGRRLRRCSSAAPGLSLFQSRLPGRWAHTCPTSNPPVQSTPCSRPSTYYLKRGQRPIWPWALTSVPFQ